MNHDPTILINDLILTPDLDSGSFKWSDPGPRSRAVLAAGRSGQRMMNVSDHDPDPTDSYYHTTTSTRVVRYYRYRVSSIGKVSGFFWYRYRSEYRGLSIENRYRKCTR